MAALKFSPVPILAAFALAYGNTSVYAQSLVLEEVIVTAQKRAETAQDVPVALTAIGADQIESMGLADFTDITRVSPSVSITQGDSKQSNSIRIRGIGTAVYSIGVEPSVLVLVDGVAQVQPGQAFSNLIDLERIEILRGPQSTLFGKNASAGAITITTKAPAASFEGSVEAVATDDEEYRVSATVSGPMTERIGYRLTGHYGDREGYIENVATGEQYNGSEDQGLRGKLNWNVTDHLRIAIAADYSKEDALCCVSTWRYVPDDTKLFGFFPFTPKVTPSDDNTKVNHDVRPETSTEQHGGSVSVAYDFNDYELTSITAYSNWKYENIGDVDGTTIDLLPVLGVSGGIVSTSDIESDFLSQEILLTSPEFEHFNYLVGAYYADAETSRRFTRTPNIDWDAVSETESMAAFGQINWNLSDRTVLSTGARYNYEKISADFENHISVRSFDASSSDSVFLGKVSLQHFLKDDTMVFISAARGYKGGAYDLSSSFNQDTADNPIDPESSNSFELGIKSTLFDGRAQVSMIAFYTDYKNYQAQGTVIDDKTFPPTGRVRVDNVGKLKTKGVEIDARALLTENLSATLALAYIDATIEEFAGADCYAGQTAAEGCIEVIPGVEVQDLAGKDLPNSPDLKLSLGTSYQLPISSMPFDGFMDFFYVWQDEAIHTLSNHPGTVQPSYGIANLNIGIVESRSEKYKITLFVNNLFDKQYATNISDGRSAIFTPVVLESRLPRNAQRYMGVRLRLNF